MRPLLICSLLACSTDVERFVVSDLPSAAGAVVRDGSNAASEASVQSSLTSATANWSGFSGATAAAYEHNLSSSTACLGDVTATQKVSAPATSDTLTATLSDGFTYFNCVRAVDATGGVSAWVASSGVTVDSIPPIAPAAFSAQNGYSQVLLSWNVASDQASLRGTPGSGVTSYQVGYCTPPAGATTCTPPTSGSGVVSGIVGTSLIIPGLANCTTYQFVVLSVDAAGNLSPSTSVATATPTVPVPQNLIVDGFVERAEMSWDAVPGASDYEVCFSRQPGACNGIRATTGGEISAFVDGQQASVIFEGGHAFGDQTFYAVRAIVASPSGCESLPTPDGGAEVTETVAPVLVMSDTSLCAGPNGFGSSVLSLVETGSFRGTMLVAGNPVVSSCTANGDDLEIAEYGTIRAATEVPADPTADLGQALANLGDINGDGIDDFINGSRLDAGAKGSATLYTSSGSHTSYVSTPIPSPSASTNDFGTAVSAIGQVDATTLAFAVTGQNSLYLFSTTATQLVPSGVVSPAPWYSLGSINFGAAVCGPGDLNNDGVPDILVSAPHGDGAVYAISGNAADGPSHLLIYAQAGVAGSGFGTTLACIGDVDGDGVGDYIVGDGQAGGTVYAFSGAATIPRASAALYGGLSWGYNFPVASLASGGDLDGDGTLDFLIGLPSAPASGYANSGEVVAISGYDGRKLFTQSGNPGSSFGTSVATANDPARNGHSGFLVGAPTDLSEGVFGSVTAFTTGLPIGVTPAEHLRASVNGGGVELIGGPVVVAGGQLSFSFSGGNPYYHTVIVNSRSGGSLSPTASNIYTAGAIGHVYDVVRVTDSSGLGVHTRIYVAATAGDPPPPPTPQPPTNVAVSGTITATSATITWTAPPALDVADPITGYVVESRHPAGQWNEHTATGTSIVLGTLLPSSEHLVRVKAQTAYSDSAWSRMLIFNTPPSP